MISSLLKVIILQLHNKCHLNVRLVTKTFSSETASLYILDLCVSFSTYFIASKIIRMFDSGDSANSLAIQFLNVGIWCETC